MTQKQVLLVYILNILFCFKKDFVAFSSSSAFTQRSTFFWIIANSMIPQCARLKSACIAFHTVVHPCVCQGQGPNSTSDGSRAASACFALVSKFGKEVSVCVCVSHFLFLLTLVPKCSLTVSVKLSEQI